MTEAPKDCASAGQQLNKEKECMPGPPESFHLAAQALQQDDAELFSSLWGLMCCPSLTCLRPLVQSTGAAVQTWPATDSRQPGPWAWLQLRCPRGA